MSKTVSNRTKGDYYYRKTALWFLERGYLVEKLEKTKITKIRGRFISIRSDTWGSDGMAMSKYHLVFFQVKFNSERRGGGYYKSRETFQKLTTPDDVEKWLIEWRPREKEPRIEKIH